MKSVVASGVLALAMGVTLAPSRRDPESRKLPEPELHHLTREIYALRTLYYFRFTREQLQKVQKIAKECAAEAREHARGKSSEDYRRLLAELRVALVAATDSERIEDLEEKVYDLQDAEKPEVDDGITITEAARKHVPGVLKQLKPTQLAGYYSLFADDITDPAEELVSNLEAIRGYKDTDWKDHRDTLAEELGWQVAGLNEEKGAKVADEASALLTKARELDNEAFKEQLPKLEKKARKIVGDVDPSTVLRHYVEHVIADLLSNPRLEAALQARLQPER